MAVDVVVLPNRLDDHEREIRVPKQVWGDLLQVAAQNGFVLDKTGCANMEGLHFARALRKALLLIDQPQPEPAVSPKWGGFIQPPKNTALETFRDQVNRRLLEAVATLAEARRGITTVERIAR
jgi:hypothetical protein